MNVASKHGYTRIACILAVLSTPLAARAELRFELETGAVWQSLNDVAVPGDGGTRVAFNDIIGSGPLPYYRFYLDYQPSERHAWRLLYAPLELEGDGRIDQPVSFAGQNFAPGAIQATYRFNSYRLTYRYLWWDTPSWQWHVGFTGKIRDARVALQQGPIRADDDNVGFVPLLHLDGAARLNERWHAILDVDAAAAPQGRAIDFAVKMRYKWTQQWNVAAGYRTLEGGADNDRVYAFAWLHYLVVSAQARF